MGAPTLALTCGTKLKVTTEGEALDRLGPPVMVALAGVLLMYTSMSLQCGPAALKTLLQEQHIWRLSSLIPFSMPSLRDKCCALKTIMVQTARFSCNEA